VEITPPFATISLEGEQGTSTGSGKERQIRIENPSVHGSVHIEATCAGYKPAQQWLRPFPAQREKLTILLEELHDDTSSTFKQPSPALPPPDISNPASPPPGATLVMTFDSGTISTKDGKQFVKDLSGHAKLGEIYGARVVPGKVGNALRFGGHEYVKVPGDYPTGTSPRTIAAWICWEESPFPEGQVQCVVKYGGGGQGRAFGISLWPDKTWGIHCHNADLRTKTHADTEWHYHAVTYDGTEGAYYFDAREVARRPIKYTDRHTHQKQTTLNTSSLPMAFGTNEANAPSRFFTGKLDEVVVYKRVLTIEEINALYRMGLNRQQLTSFTSNGQNRQSGH
jgi:hypothetical protein